MKERDDREARGLASRPSGAPPRDSPTVAVLVPARDEEETLPRLFERLQRDLVDRILVVDNGSRDRTAEVARERGADVVAEPVAGYGRACQRGLARLSSSPPVPDLVVFLDADDWWAAGQLERLLWPLVDGRADLVLGGRVPVGGEGVAPHAALGNRLVAGLLRGLYGTPVTDMAPFRAARLSTLRALRLDDPAFGWNVQMQVRAARAGWRIRQVPVAFRPRAAGTSKISGSVLGSLAAARGMLVALAREVVRAAPA